jgi:hypothetical protein
MDVTPALGGMADGFSFRHEVEIGRAQTRPLFDQVLVDLGFPHASPEPYFKYSVMYHLEGLPAVCLLYGVDNPDGLAVRTGELRVCPITFPPVPTTPPQATGDQLPGR